MCDKGHFIGENTVREKPSPKMIKQNIQYRINLYPEFLTH